MVTREKIKTIGYMGWVNKLNLGDDLLESSFEQLCQRHLTRPYQIISMREHPPDAKYDLFVSGGGNLLSAWQSGWDIQLEHFAQRMPSVVFGTGVNEYRNGYTEGDFKTTEAGKFKLIQALKFCRSIWVRDTHSKEIIQSLNTHCNPQIIPDLGFAYIFNENDTLFEKYHISKNKKIFLINVTWSDILSIDGNNVVFANLFQFINYLLNNTDYIVVLLPIFIHDISITKYLYKQIKNNRTNLINITEYHNVDEILTLMKYSSMLLGIKLHSMIMATKVGLPFIPLIHKHKCSDYLNDINYAVQLSNLDHYFEYIRAYEFIQKNYDLIQQHLIKINQEYHHQVDRAFISCIKFLMEGGELR